MFAKSISSCLSASSGSQSPAGAKPCNHATTRKSCRVRPPCSAGNVTQWHQRGCCCAREPQPSPNLKPQMRPHTSLTIQMRQQPELELEPEPDVAVRPVCNVCNSVLVHPKME